MKILETLVKISLLTGSTITVGCGDVGGGVDGDARVEEGVGADHAPMTGGSLLPSDVEPFTSAIRLEWKPTPQTTSHCSGIKVASNVYWTAGHCAYDYKVGGTIKITAEPSGAFSGSTSYTRTIATVDVHPSFVNSRVLLPWTGRIVPHYDVARFTLTSTTPNIPAFSSTDSTWVAPNKVVVYTGYGCDNTDPTHSGKKQWASFILEDEAEAAEAGQGIDAYTHDMIDVSDTLQGCPGDSGAPAWLFDGSTYKTVGLAVRGGFGYTAFTRYSNVRKWLASPAFNQFQVGFKGFLLNHDSGRCIKRTSSGITEAPCDGRLQESDYQSWWLASSGSTPGFFYIVNGGSGKCLAASTTRLNAALVEQTCLPTSQVNDNLQRWKFTASSHANYRRLVNTSTNFCVAKASSSDGLTAQSCTNADPEWRAQAWLMTR
jgi:hypothetical protein